MLYIYVTFSLFSVAFFKITISIYFTESLADVSGIICNVGDINHNAYDIQKLYIQLMDERLTYCLYFDLYLI